VNGVRTLKCGVMAGRQRRGRGRGRGRGFDPGRGRGRGGRGTTRGRGLGYASIREIDTTPFCTSNTSCHPFETS
jgi:hypothetical protein